MVLSARTFFALTAWLVPVAIFSDCAGAAANAGPPPTVARAEPAPRFPPWQIPVRAEPRVVPRRSDLVAFEGNRCEEKTRERVFVFDGERLVRDQSVDELFASESAVVVDHGGRERRGIVMREMFAGDGAVEVWPCRGEPVRIEAEKARSFVLVETGKGSLKLLRRAADGGAEPVLKNVAAFAR